LLRGNKPLQIANLLSARKGDIALGEASAQDAQDQSAGAFSYNLRYIAGLKRPDGDWHFGLRSANERDCEISPQNIAFLGGIEELREVSDQFPRAVLFDYRPRNS